MLIIPIMWKSMPSCERVGGHTDSLHVCTVCTNLLCMRRAWGLTTRTQCLHNSFMRAWLPSRERIQPAYVTCARDLLHACTLPARVQWAVGMCALLCMWYVPACAGLPLSCIFMPAHAHKVAYLHVLPWQVVSLVVRPLGLLRLGQ